jgi:virulence-associated protein VagC
LAKKLAKLFFDGERQAVRLPRGFRFPGKYVSMQIVPEGVLLKPLKFDTVQWFAELDRLASEPFMKTGRNQPKTPRRAIFK